MPTFDDEVFALLRDRGGPLDVSQICVELHLDLEDAMAALNRLREKGAVAVRREGGVTLPPDDPRAVWELRILP